MGQVGGNESVVWQNQHRLKRGKFKCKDHDKKLERDELGLVDALEVWGRDDVAIEDIGTTPAPGINLVAERTGFKQEPGYFLVRLRFDGEEATAIQNWFKAPSRPPNVMVYEEGRSTIMAINVRAVRREWPKDNVSWLDLPWEIRYDW